MYHENKFHPNWSFRFLFFRLRYLLFSSLFFLLLSISFSLLRFFRSFSNIFPFSSLTSVCDQSVSNEQSCFFSRTWSRYSEDMATRQGARRRNTAATPSTCWDIPRVGVETIDYPELGSQGIVWIQTVVIRMVMFCQSYSHCPMTISNR